MKRFIIPVAALLCATQLASCYSTKLYVGDIEKTAPVVEVNKEWNHHVIAGLVPIGNNKLAPADYVDNSPNYMVKTNTSFINYIIAGITFGLYTPTQTIFYVPMSDINKK